MFIGPVALFDHTSDLVDSGLNPSWSNQCPDLSHRPTQITCAKKIRRDSRRPSKKIFRSSIQVSGGRRLAEVYGPAVPPALAFRSMCASCCRM